MARETSGFRSRAQRNCGTGPSSERRAERLLFGPIMFDSNESCARKPSDAFAADPPRCEGIQ